jgi:hypothetical protein
MSLIFRKTPNQRQQGIQRFLGGVNKGDCNKRDPNGINRIIVPVDFFDGKVVVLLEYLPVFIKMGVSLLNNAQGRMDRPF